MNTSAEMAGMKTEDEVRQTAGRILGFGDCAEAVSGTGQITTFNQLGFKGVNDKPDGWYLPKNRNVPAVILETKSGKIDISRMTCINELKKNTDIVATKYAKVVGILYNGTDVIVTKNGEVVKAAPTLQAKEYYIALFESVCIDRHHIYTLTQRINNALHVQFGISNLYHRMIFTACALVAERYDANLVKVKDLGYDIFKRRIHDTLSRALHDVEKGGDKLQILLDVYDEIEMDTPNNQSAIDEFIDCVVDISESTNSDRWNGEDVMAIFFNEFNRYKGKSEHGQVFTPDHITSFMYRLIGVGMNDRVLDAACGSGAFLVKAMCNMIREAGGVRTRKAAAIKAGQLFGIEKSRLIFALACANMLIHKDGWTNLAQMDSTLGEASEWIRSKGITKVLMNPPFETKYGCVKIVANVLDSVPKGTQCAFIMPDKKLEKDKSARKILKRHSLVQIVKLPEKVFDAGVTTSVFVFESGVPQDGKQIFACHMSDDGLETVKNQGRQDVRGRWQEIENRWIGIIYKRTGDDSIQWLNPDEHLSWQAPVKPFDVHDDDFMHTMMDYLLFKHGRVVDADFKVAAANSFLYACNAEKIRKFYEHDAELRGLDVGSWRKFRIGDLFKVVKGKRLTRKDMVDGKIPFVGASAINNGITHYVANEEYVHPAGTLTVSYNGSVGESFYQDASFRASDDVNVLYPKFKMTRNIALFVASVIRVVGRRYEFIDKWVKETMEKDEIKLPVSGKDPDWQGIESYMAKIEQIAQMRLEAFI